MMGIEAMDDAERAAPAGNQQRLAVTPPPVPGSDGRRTDSRRRPQGGDWPRRAAIGPVDRYLCGLLPDLNCGLLAQPATRAARGTRGPELSRPRHFPRRGPLAKDASAKGAIRRRFAASLALAPDRLPLRFAP